MPARSNGHSEARPPESRDSIASRASSFERQDLSVDIKVPEAAPDIAKDNERLCLAISQQTEIIERLIQGDAERVSKIAQMAEDFEKMRASYIAQQEVLESLSQENAGRLTKIGEMDHGYKRLYLAYSQQTEIIERLIHGDAERVSKIAQMAEDFEKMRANYIGQQEVLERLSQENTERLTKIGEMDRDYKRLYEAYQSIHETLHATWRENAENEAGRVSTINSLMELDATRVSSIKQLDQLNIDRVATIERLMDRDADRLTTISELTDRFFVSDGITALGRSTEFMDEPIFANAWEKSAEANVEGWPNGVPDVRWRASIALWAARNGLHLQGDFVECGVHTGLLSLVIFHALNFSALSRNFYLFDTFNGVPLDGLEGVERELAIASNEHVYLDVWDIAKRNFSPFKNAKLVRGVLPDSLNAVKFDKIAYLSMDLNVADAEICVIERLWDHVVPGAIILLDDYGWAGCKQQFTAWNDFANRVEHHIAVLPTGQGLLIKR